MKNPAKWSGTMETFQHESKDSITTDSQPMDLLSLLSYLPFPISSEGLSRIVSLAAEHHSDLEALLESEISKAERGEWHPQEEESNEVLYAFFLLVNAKHPASFGLALRMLGLGRDWLEAYFGDVATESFPSVLISTCGNRTDELAALVLKPEVWIISRFMAYDALVGLAFKQDSLRAVVFETLRSLYANLKSGQETKSEFFHMCVDSVVPLRPVDLIPELTQWLESYPALPGSGFSDLESLVEEIERPAYTGRVEGEFNLWKLSESLRRFDREDRELMLKEISEVRKIEKRRKKNKEARKKRKSGRR
jgi:hypothetical protein